jgi:hypothetical protein
MTSPSSFLFIATPSFNSQVSYSYLHSLLQATVLFNEQHLSFGLSVNCGDSLVTRSRNTLVAYFLREPQATHLMFIDSDIGYEATDILKLIHHDQDIVAGAYPLKRLNWDNIATNQQKTPADAEQAGAVFGTNLYNRAKPNHKPIYRTLGPLVEAKDVATGFMLIKRSVIESLVKHHPELHYLPDNNQNPNLAPFLYDLFHPMIDPKDHSYLSEDFAFCRLWQNLGGRVWLDPTIKLTHTGSYTFSGDYSQFFHSYTWKI